uniref:hypothetical protein n=1 Tax=Amycolatopsis sp. CA-096443 TaxID=3239919 RepID=UPI003F496CEE
MPAKKDHTVTVTYRDNEKSVHAMTAEQARQSQELPNRNLDVVNVEVDDSAPRRD